MAKIDEKIDVYYLFETVKLLILGAYIIISKIYSEDIIITRLHVYT